MSTVPTDVTLSDFTGAATETLEHGLEHFIAQLAFRIEDTYKATLHVGYGVDTGAMQQSASAVTSEGSHYAENVAAAAEMNPKAEFAPEPTMSGPFEAAVIMPVHYAAAFEFGGAVTPAHPALVPAIETVISQANNIAREVFDV